jgi:myo-inositol-1(or 4)-monophosphatase
MIDLLETALQTARLAADAAAHIHRAHGTSVTVADATEKGRADYVSATDLAAQDACLSIIRDRHPEHAIMAEEDEGGMEPGPEVTPSDGPVWVVDPLDGTANFLHNHPMHAASVALAIDGTPVVGAVSCAPTDEHWWAARGHGAWKNGHSIGVSSLSDHHHALVGTGFPFKSESLLEEYAAQLVRVLAATGGVRRGGAAALDLCYLAEGRFDAFWELFLNPWDFAAGWVIIEEAGGVTSRIGGAPLSLCQGGVMGANSPAMLEAISTLLEIPDLLE